MEADLEAYYATKWIYYYLYHSQDHSNRADNETIVDIVLINAVTFLCA